VLPDDLTALRPRLNLGVTIAGCLVAGALCRRARELAASAAAGPPGCAGVVTVARWRPSRR
jgi:hypothetical protein